MNWGQSIAAISMGAVFISVSSAAVIGSYTFDDNTGATQFLIGNLDDPTNVATGAGLSELGVNPSIGYAGGNNVPPSGPDGFGFGGNLGEQVMFWRRAANGQSSLWGTANDSRTPIAEAPMNLTVSADPGFEVTVDSILIESVNSPDAINNLQVDGAPVGAAVTSAVTTNPYRQNLVLLDVPVTVAGGTSTTFTVLWNSGSFDQLHKVNFIDVNGSVVPEPSTALLLLVLAAVTVRRGL